MNLVYPFHLYFGLICLCPENESPAMASISSLSWFQQLGLHLSLLSLPFNSGLPGNFKQLVAQTRKVNGINSGGN